jgi:ferredoxin
VGPAVRAAGGTVVNLDAGPFVTIPVTGVVRRSFVLPRVLFEVDAVVQVPKLKAHSLTVISAAMKNLIGVMPGATKCALHVEVPAPRDFAHGIIDLFLALGAGGARLEGAVVDAVWALAGRDGRDEPVVRRLEVVVAGSDLTAVDVACARLLGLDPNGVPTIRAALQRRVGPPLLDRVELHGDPLPRCAEPAPGCPPGLKERSLLAARAHYWMRGRIVLPEHDPSRCGGQRRCVELCPVDAIRFEGRRAVIDGKCIGCYACHEQCPSGAMRLRTPWALRGLLRQRAEGLDVGKVTGGARP